MTFKKYKKGTVLKPPFLLFIFYSQLINTFFLIITIPLTNIIVVPNTIAIYKAISLPVFIVTITGASSISSSPGTLFPGVESLSGTPYSL
jgi:hypothetical protein